MLRICQFGNISIVSWKILFRSKISFRCLSTNFDKYFNPKTFSHNFWYFQNDIGGQNRRWLRRRDKVGPRQQWQQINNGNSEMTEKGKVFKKENDSKTTNRVATHKRNLAQQIVRFYHQLCWKMILPNWAFGDWIFHLLWVAMGRWQKMA